MKTFGGSGKRKTSLNLNLAISSVKLKERPSGLSTSQSFVTTDCIKQTKGSGSL